MKKITAGLIALCLLLSGCAASGDASGPISQASGVTVTDSNGDEAALPNDPEVVCLYGSYAHAWLLAGGTLAGVTEDAVKERQLDVGAAAVVGTVKEPNTEAIIALDPDWVILSADIAAQVDCRDVLENAGLACSYFRVDTFEDYETMMKEFRRVTGRDDLFEENVTQAGNLIEDVKTAVSGVSDAPDVLLIRAFSSGIKAKTDDELAGAILKDLGAHNIADDHPSMLEELSLEEVILADPDYIFVTTMGDEGAALSYLDSQISENPAWQGLSAVKEGRYVVLPKNLFHYKPNNLWGQSYEYLAQILYPDAFPG